jgi:F420-non-reducing hydrogenase small subunit
MSAKPKVAFYWCASCGGCEEAVVDLGEALVDVAGEVEIVFWPVALDFKRDHIEALADGEVAATFLNGAIRTSEQEEMARLLRRKSRLLIAFGSCSQAGGIPGLANLYSRDSILRTVYSETPSTVNPEGTLPQPESPYDGGRLTLPVFFDAVRAVDQVVEVDYYVPGCPPTSKLLSMALEVLLHGELPPPGTVLAPDRALCEECPRKDSKPEKLALKKFLRPSEAIADPEKCLLAQGFLCLGPATRGGCEALCIRGNMPCTGCFGPTSRVRDFGGKALSAVASLVDSNDEEEIRRILDGIPDPTGTFYRYSLPASLLERRAEARPQSGGSIR